MPTNLNESSNHQAAVLRALDANLNRTREALRVIEDSCRFVFGSRNLTRQCKSLRHELSAWAKSFETSDLILARDAAGDVGRHSEQASEYVRENIEHIIKANFSRAQQALRALEEFSKTIDGQLGRRAEVIRYQVYELERSVLVAFFSQQRLTDVRLYVLVDGGENSDAFSRRVRQLIAAGLRAIQLRDKTLDDQTLLERAKSLVQLTRDSNTLAIVNDRVDLAMAAKADGVHLGQDDMPAGEARGLTGPRMLIGLSTHSIEQARQAEQLPVNYIGVGPTFASKTKSFENFTGVEFLKQVASEISLPAFAIGGITENNLAEVTDCGFHRVAVCKAIPMEDKQSVQAMVSLFHSALESASKKADSE